MIRRRLITPGLSGREGDEQGGDAVGQADRTFKSLGFAQNDWNRTRRRDGRGFKVLAVDRPILQFRRQADPELKTAQSLRCDPRHFLSVPYAASCAHPFNASISNHALTCMRIRKPHVTLRDQSDGGYPRMRMHWHAAHQRRVAVEEIEKHEWF